MFNQTKTIRFTKVFVKTALVMVCWLQPDILIGPQGADSMALQLSEPGLQIYAEVIIQVI